MTQTFGTDAEFFVVDADEHIVPPRAIELDYGATMVEVRDKRILYTHSNGVMFSEDGAACELYTRPYANAKELETEVKDAVTGLEQYVNSFGLFLSRKMVGFFDVDKYWYNRDESFLDCVRIGCNPDLSIYETLLNKPTSVARRIEGDPYRYCGGHFQISTPDGNEWLFSDNYLETTFMFDHLLGTGNVLLERDQQQVADEKQRLEQYGHPGRLRLQEYPNGKTGIEYRPPSNRWVFANDAIAKNYGLMQVVTKAVESGMATKFLDEHFDPVYFETLYNDLVAFDRSRALVHRNTMLTFLKEHGIISPAEFDYYL